MCTCIHVDTWTRFRHSASSGPRTLTAEVVIFPSNLSVIRNVWFGGMSGTGARLRHSALSIPGRRMHGPSQREFHITVAVLLCTTTPLEGSLRHCAPQQRINSILRLAFGPAPLALPLLSLHATTQHAHPGSIRAGAEVKQGFGGCHTVTLT